MKFIKYFFSYLFLLISLATLAGVVMAIKKENGTNNPIVLAESDSLATPNDLSTTPPNIIFILTDDMDSSLLQYMPRLKTYVTDRGMNYKRFFINDPLCCPSRITILKGQYAHNTTIFANTAPYGGFSAFKRLGYENSCVNNQLQQLGYKTILIGKYLNDYPSPDEPTYVPPGWSQWFVPTTGTAYGNYNYDLNENGTIVQYGEAAEDYLTDVVSRKALSLIDQYSVDKKPYFMFLSVYAPHGPATPAPRHAGLFNDLVLPRSPSFNEANINDKPSFIKKLPLVQNWVISSIMQPLYQNKARSLQSVDEMIQAIVQKLEQTGQTSNTYIFFASDNGFHLGEHRLYKGKGTAYEEDIRVPLIIKGPSIPAASENNYITGNIDLAPTFLDLAYRGLGKGVYKPGTEMDGRSLVPLFSGRKNLTWRRFYLIEWANTIFPVSGGSLAAIINQPTTEDVDKTYDHAGEPTAVTIPNANIPAFAGLRSDNFTYIEYQNGEKEFYNLPFDPYQLTNFANGGGGDWVPATLKNMAQRLRLLVACKGDSCRSNEGSLVGN